ncbi:MAG: sigma-70 family RNA polymerase sigma factor [Deltaproteobacteria bacterium]|nr:sigma-70 family RNA polymerase sigma factor [Deltaproteobacteria bacterium]
MTEPKASATPPPPPGEPSDSELVLRAQQGDATAFAQLVSRHQRQLYRLALRMTQSEADAQEILQETFLNAYQKLPNFRGEAQFSSWLYRIAANSALMRLRRKRRAPDALPTEPLELTGPKFNNEGYFEEAPHSDWSQRADEKLMSGELGKAIDAAVKTLPDDYRTVFLLKDVDGLSNEEIADALELSVPAVKSRLHRARLALREQLGEFFS